MGNKVGRPKGSKYNIDEYIGKTVHNWIIIGFSHLNKNGDQYWEAKCSCGYVSKIRVYPLLNGVTKSCKHCRPQSRAGELSPWWKGSCEFSITYYHGIMNSALKRGLEFNLEPEYLQNLFNKQNGRCRYSGLLLTLSKSNRDVSSTASLDRIDSSKGYVKGNVQWVHKKVNKMKMDITEEDFLFFCKEIYVNLSKI